MVWEGLEVVTTTRQMLGATNPANSPPGTIRSGGGLRVLCTNPGSRGDFGLVPGRNIIHGSDSVEAGQREVGLWFSNEELVEWSPAQADWVYDN